MNTYIKELQAAPEGGLEVMNTYVKELQAASGGWPRNDEHLCKGTPGCPLGGGSGREVMNTYVKEVHTVLVQELHAVMGSCFIVGKHLF